MTGGYLKFLRKKIPVNNSNIKTTPAMATLSKKYNKYEKKYYEHKKLNRLSYEDFQKINWRR